MRARLKRGAKAASAGFHGQAVSQGKQGADWPVRVRHVVFPKASGTGFVSFGPMIPRKVPAWASVPDEQPQTLRIKRAQPIHALNRIAEQLPNKLPVVALPDMKKKPAKKKTAPKKGPRKDAAQNALSIVERVTGGKLKG